MRFTVSTPMTAVWRWLRATCRRLNSENRQSAAFRPERLPSVRPLRHCPARRQQRRLNRRVPARFRLPNPYAIVQIAMMTSQQPYRCRTALALQGGGSHGAYAWGVLDALLAAGEVFDAVCGVSSGAILGTMAVQGFVRGGRTAPGRRWRSSGTGWWRPTCWRR